MRFGKGSWCDAAAFAPDGTALATGSTDGFVELYDFEAESCGATSRTRPPTSS